MRHSRQLRPPCLSPELAPLAHFAPLLLVCNLNHCHTCLPSAPLVLTPLFSLMPRTPSAIYHLRHFRFLRQSPPLPHHFPDKNNETSSDIWAPSATFVKVGHPDEEKENMIRRIVDWVAAPDREKSFLDNLAYYRGEKFKLRQECNVSQNHVRSSEHHYRHLPIPRSAPFSCHFFPFCVRKLDCPKEQFILLYQWKYFLILCFFLYIFLFASEN